MSGGLEMSKRYIREDLERVTKHTLHIRDLYTYFMTRSFLERHSTDITIENEVLTLHGRKIEVAELTITDHHGLIFKVSSNFYYYDVFEKYIVGNYSQYVDKWKYSPIHINLYEDPDKVFALFKELGKKKHLKRLRSNKEYINILYSDLYRTYNI